MKVVVFVCDSRGRYLVALGRSWHPEEFTCSQCKKVLDEGGFFEERGSVYCTKCYDNRYAPNCTKCKKKITGVRAALLRGTNRLIRQQSCWMWVQVHVCLHEDSGIVEASSLFCQEIMHALKMTYHVQCFKCAACKTPIRNQAFYMEEGEPYCERGKPLKLAFS